MQSARLRTAGENSTQIWGREVERIAFGTRSEAATLRGRTIVLNSRAGRTERFVGVTAVGDSRLSLAWRPADPVELIGTASVYDRLMDADERTIPMLLSNFRVGQRWIEGCGAVRRSDRSRIFGSFKSVGYELFGDL